MLVQCPALAHLNLYKIEIGAAGADSFAGVLTWCPALAHLILFKNEIRESGTESFAGVLPHSLNIKVNQQWALSHDSFKTIFPGCSNVIVVEIELSQR